MKRITYLIATSAGLATLAGAVAWHGGGREASEIVVVPGAASAVRAIATISPAPTGSAQALATAIRSVLYPADWLPLNDGGTKTADGRFLQDFSYAGFAAGEKSIPTGFGGRSVNVVTQFGADNSYNAQTNPNAADATGAIQRAIDDICDRGGGVVNLPAGSYRIKPPAGENAAIRLACNNVIVRGATDGNGAPTTYLFNDEQDMRQKRVFLAGAQAAGAAPWYTVQTDVRAVTSNSTDPTRIITLASTAGLAVGNGIIVATDVTDAFRTAHGMGPGQGNCGSLNACWPGTTSGPIYQRFVREILSGNRVRLDAPVRYWLTPGTDGNNPRVYRTATSNYNIGIENVAIGMRENTKGNLNDASLNVAGTAAYETNNAQVIRFVGARDSWVRNVRTYRPTVNTGNFHIQSLGIVLTASTRNISVIDTSIGYAQNKLVGGNGYLFLLGGGDSLLQNCIATAGRHNFQFAGMAATGNVILGGESRSSSLVNDFHVGLSVANLIDSVTTSGVGWEAVNRGSTSDGAGITGTQNVFWNMKKADASGSVFIRSAQWAWGYVIGTRGTNATVSTSTPMLQSPADWSEAIGNGADLEPQSLFLDQRAKRLADPSY